MQALTQYLEVILTARLFDQADLTERYFASYRERLAVSTEIGDLKASTAIASAAINKL